MTATQTDSTTEQDETRAAELNGRLFMACIGALEQVAALRYGPDVVGEPIRILANQPGDIDRLRRPTK